ncbi:MAG TPA: hypothetical protein VM142_05040 [Acidimicrobiales bacterium]|nr:hypothetical protein [Acidimicrobiales bacterium]
MAFAPRRRRRRRSRLIVVGLLLSLVALLVNAGYSSSSRSPSKRLARLAYIDQVRPHVDRSTLQGDDITLVRAQATKLGRNGIRRKMGRVRRDAAVELRAVRGLDPPPELSANHSLLVSTMVLRSRGSSMMSEALDLALGEGPPQGAVDGLVKAGEDLSAADQTYRTFVELIGTEGATARVLPESRWVAEPADWDPSAIAAFVGALRASAISTPVHDVSLLTFATDPRPVGSETGSAVLPLVKTLRVEVVVANIGNAAESRVPVVVTLTGPAGEVDTAREFVDLAPGQRKAVAVGGLRPVPGGPSTLTVAVGPVEGERGAADNERSSSLVMRG